MNTTDTKSKILQFLSRQQVWGFLVSVAAMAIISIAFFYPDNFEGNQLRQADMMQGAANGHEAELYYQQTGVKPLWTNALMSGMPTFQISPTYPSNDLFTWLNSVYGLWLPSPSNLLFMMMLGMLICLYCLRMRWYYALIGAVAWGFSSYFIIIIGAGHIWKFLALTYIPPTIGGLILCYRGRWIIGGAMAALFAMLQLNANHPQMSYYFAWVMAALVIGYLVMAIRRGTLRQWLAGSAALLVAGILAVAANLPSLYNTYLYSKETKRATSELALETAADQQKLQTEMAQSGDAATVAERPTGGMPRQEILGWSYGLSETWSLLVPNIKGGASARPEGGQMVGMTLDRLPEADNYPMVEIVNPGVSALCYFPQYFNPSEGTNGPVYVGAVIFALFLLGCVIVRGPVKWALLVMTVVSIVLAWGINAPSLSDWMIYNFPMYNKFRAVESILVIAEFCMPVLAIMALQRLLTADANTWRTQYRLPFFVCFGFSLLVSFLAAVAPGIFGEVTSTDERAALAQLPNAMRAVTDLRQGLVSADGWRSFWFIAVGGIVLWWSMSQKTEATAWRRAAVVGVGLIVLFDLYGVGKRYVSHSSFAQQFQSAQPAFVQDQIDQQILRDQRPQYRVMDIPGFAQATRSYWHRTIGGYHAAKLNRYEDLINHRMSAVRQLGYIPELRDDSVRASYPADAQQTIDQLLADYRVLDMLNAAYVIDTDDAGNQYVLQNPTALGPAWLVPHIQYVNSATAEMQALETLQPAVEAVAAQQFQPTLGDGVAALSPNDGIALTAYAPDRLKYTSQTSADGVIAVFSEIFFPWGWHATIDGTETALGRVDYTLRAMRLPAGQHEIEMWFSPDSLGATGACAYAAVTLIYMWVLAALFVYWRRRQKVEA